MSYDNIVLPIKSADVGKENSVVEGGTINGFISVLAKIVGAPEPAFRLLLSILAAYPISSLYICYFQNVSLEIRHLYFTLGGILLCAFNYGFDVYHSAISIWITYLLIRLTYKNPKWLIILNLAFNMGYLLIGYIFTESDSYDINWTTPHCVLTLRLIGFGFDIADGQLANEQLSKDQKDTALSQIPSLLELTAFAYFPAGFLIGPQFPFKRYQRFVTGQFRQFDGYIKAGILRGSIGVLYLAIRQIGTILLPDSYFLTDEYDSLSFAMKLLNMGLWAKISLYKYISCWLLAEGAMMICGFTYAGKKNVNKKEINDWSGCSNVNLLLFETGTKMTHYVQSFNVNTNNWVSQYVYKRLKFLNNRTISYAGALFFLAVWHGFHSGYYMAFLIEYSIITTEKQFENFYTKVIIQKYGDIFSGNIVTRTIKFGFLKAYNMIYMGWCLVPFIQLSYQKWMHGFSIVYYFGFVIVIGWQIFNLIYNLINLLKRKKLSKPSQDEDMTSCFKDSALVINDKNKEQ